MKRPASASILVQVAALAALAVILSQAVAFAVVVLSPEPRPAGFTVAAAAEALSGREATTSDGRPLRRRILSAPPQREVHTYPLAPLLRDSLARRLDVDPDRVRVWGNTPPPPEQGRRVIFAGSSEAPPAPPALPAQPLPLPPPPGASREAIGQIHIETRVMQRNDRRITIGAGEDTLTILADRLTFAPFSAGLRLEDGSWAVVEPPRGLLSPWQVRTLLALAISLLLLAPLVWWMARRLTRPIRAFAQAAQRLGADPDAEPMVPTGPSEVRTAIDAFNDMQASLKDHIRKRTQTIAAIAHDLRTPLTRLRFRAEQAPDALRDRMAEDIEEMDALIGQAMRYVRGEQPLERLDDFDLELLAADCVRGFRDTGAQVGFVEGPPLPVQGDPAALRRALDNLIANALQYAGGTQVVARADSDVAVIEVHDDGAGMAEGELDAVFEPFRRGERSRNRETGGAGLGLTVARQAARAHGGDVILINRAGGGLTARLTLPLTHLSETA